MPGRQFKPSVAVGKRLFEMLEPRVLFDGSPVITGLNLVQASNGAEISPVATGEVLDLKQLGSISIEADTDIPASQVVFSVDGQTFATDTAAPYYIAGVDAGSPVGWVPTSGNHTLVVTPYLDDETGTATTLSLTIVNGTVVTTPTKLTGQLIGTSGSYRSQGNTIANAVDGSTSTFFDAPTAGGSWVGYDLGAGYQITSVKYVPRSGYDSRMVGGIFQGSNTADFSSGVSNLFTVSATPKDNVFATGSVSDVGSYEFVRYLSPSNGDCNVAEIEFDGIPTAIETNAPDSPDAPAATATSNDIHLSWSEDATSIVDSYSIERLDPNDSDYHVVGSTNGRTTSFDDKTVAAATTYSYEIVATNSIGSSDPSASTSVTTLMQVTVGKLTGTIIGTSGSYRSQGNTGAKALDGNLSTYFDAPTASGSWVGYDLGSAYQITTVKYAPRAGYGSRMVGGVFQGSNTADFSSGVITLFTITASPKDNVYASAAVKDTGGYRYVRYLSPTNGDCNVAEIEFDGMPGTVVVNNNFPTKVSFTTGAPSPIVRAEAVGQTVNGKVYVFGGFNADGSVDTTIPLQHRCDVYDPATNKWTRLKDFPEPFTHSQGVVVGNDIWFVGGYLGDHPGPGTTHVWVYDTTNDSWTRGPDLPQARGAGAAALVGNTIYFTGGMNQTRTVDENTTYALDLNNQSAGWVQKANLPNGRNHVAAASLGGYLYVLGGQHGQEENQSAQSEVDRYDPSTNTWTKVASLPSQAGKSHITEGTLVYNGRIIVVGGETGYNVTQKAIMDYDPKTNTWSQLGSLPAARSTVVAGIVNGKLIVTTGNSPDPTTTTWIGTLS